MIIDANIHLLKITSEGYNSPNKIKTLIDQKFDNMTEREISDLIKKTKINMKNNKISESILYILYNNLYKKNLKNLCLDNELNYGVLLDLNDPNYKKTLKTYKENNINFIKLLPYELKLLKKDYKKVLTISNEIQKNNMILTICGAYGSRYVYDTNGVELAAFLLNNNYTSPIIIAHGGMTRVFDTMSLMLEFPNLYMDTSFTLNYWKGSRIWDDYNFVFKKLNYERIFYGSDYPYVSFEDSIEVFNEFCDYYELNHQEKENILKSNFQNFVKKEIVV